jgi:hypothetical protein
MINVFHFEAGGEKFPLAFTINVTRALQAKYGDPNKVFELIKDAQNPDLSALVFLFLEAINEGIDIENEKLEVPRPFLSEKQVGRILSDSDMAQSMKTMFELIKKSTPDMSKNVRAAKNQKETKA